MRGALRLGPAAAVAALAMSPAVAAAQDQCRAIRAMTNADGRKFADLQIGIARSYGITVRGGRGEALPTPKDCDVSADAESVDLSCTWLPGSYEATAAFYESLFARLQSCLGGRLAAPSGPRPHGGFVALRQSETALATDGGETTVTLALIEAPEGEGVPAYHYVRLAVSHMAGEPD